MQIENNKPETDCDSSFEEYGPPLGPDLNDEEYEDYLAQHRMYDL